MKKDHNIAGVTSPHCQSDNRHRPRLWIRIIQAISQRLSGASPDTASSQTENRYLCNELLHQAEISNALLETLEHERRRIATDLHDSIGQKLSAVKMCIETVQRDMSRQISGERQQQALGRALAQLRTTADELRRIALGLRPSMLDDLGLLPTLEWCCREFAQTHPHLDLVRNVAVEEGEVPPVLRCDIYRVIQEALHNVTKHASASKVEISLFRDTESLVLRIEDDGCGFDLRAVTASGIGLYSMQARSERRGGRMWLHSAHEAGTRIVFHWPLSAGNGADKGVQQPFMERRVNERRRNIAGVSGCSAAECPNMPRHRQSA